MSQPIHHIRRRERAVEDDAWISSFLQRAQFGSVASVEEGQPFINPVIFVYEPTAHALYFHTGRAGRIYANLTANPRLCFNACEMIGLIAGTAAAGFDVVYESVMVFGQAQVIAEAAEATHVLQLLLAKYFPHLRYGEDYQPIVPEQLTPTAVWRVPVEAWSGKRKAMGD